MIKNIKAASDKALINYPKFRIYLTKLDSDIMRGSNTILVLDVIANMEPQGSYGYEINQILQTKSSHSINLGEPTLYKLLKKLHKENVILARKVEKRTYFTLTQLGWVIYDYAMGFFANIAVSLLDFNKQDFELSHNVVFCPTCSNRIRLEDRPPRFCRICGTYIQNLLEKLIKAKNLPLNKFNFVDFAPNFQGISSFIGSN
ncbi:MAG: helix-turn-helix transcriptional regulator [Promethearchaeota archaeon]